MYLKIYFQTCSHLSSTLHPTCIKVVIKLYLSSSQLATPPPPTHKFQMLVALKLALLFFICYYLKNTKKQKVTDSTNSPINQSQASDVACGKNADNQPIAAQQH